MKEVIETENTVLLFMSLMIRCSKAVGDSSRRWNQRYDQTLLMATLQTIQRIKIFIWNEILSPSRFSQKE